MGKPDLSKQGMQRFFLYHSEKLILAACIAAMGLFFWMGYSAEIFRDRSPNELSDLATQAGKHILNDTSWDKIEGLRQGDDQIVKRIVESQGKLEAGNYPHGVLSVKVKTKEPRKDPRLYKPVDLMAFQFTAPLIITPILEANQQLGDPLEEFPIAMGTSGSDFGGRGGSGGIGPPGMGRASWHGRTSRYGRRTSRHWRRTSRHGRRTSRHGRISI